MTALAISDKAAQEGPPSSAWIVVVTNRHAEKLVKAAIEAQKFEVYLPMRQVRHRHGGTVAVPLFPRYLFVRITREATRWQLLFTTQGVMRVMCTMRRPIGVKNELIEKLREKELEVLKAFGAEEAAKACPFKAGDKVVTLDGLVDGIFVEPVDDKRVAILTSLIGGDSRIATVDLRNLAHPQSADG